MRKSVDAMIMARDGGSDVLAFNKPKKVLSPEHSAKLMAGRQAKSVAKAAAKAMTAFSSYKPFSGKTQKEFAGGGVTPIINGQNLQEGKMMPFNFGGITYLRIGMYNPDGSHKWLSGDLWLSKKGMLGFYVGRLMSDGSINSDAEEPALHGPGGASGGKRRNKRTCKQNKRKKGSRSYKR
jgi:hypothetical protein